MLYTFLAIAGVCALLAFLVFAAMSNHPTRGTDFPIMMFILFLLGVPLFLLLAFIAWLEAFLI